MRHTTSSRGMKALVTATAALLALGGLTASASAAPPGAPTMPGGAVPMATTGGCGRAAGLSSGVHTITSGGISRTYRLDVPAGYDPNRAYRLVVGLHWWHGTASDVVNEGFYGLKPLANNSTIFVAPQGIDNAWPNTNGRDVAFIDDLLRTLDANLCIDTTQRFATGFSYGGGMSNALACARADVFRGVAVLNGAQLSGCDGGTQPIAYLGSHGVSDDVLAISQGRALRDRALRNNGCQAQNAPEPAAGSGTHTRTEYNCRDGYPVVWIASDSGHQWAARDRGQQQSFVPGEVWRFFSSLTSTTTPPPTTPPPTTPPPTTPPPTTPPPTTPPPTGDCTVSVTRGQEWGDRFNVNLSVSGASDWTTTINLGSGQTLQNSWNANVTGTSGRLTATPDGSGNDFGITLYKNGNTTLPTASCTGSGSTPPPTTPPPTTPPPTTPPPTTPPPTTPPPSGTCSAMVTVNQWTGGFVATVRVTAGTAPLNGWTVTAALPPGAAVSSSWSSVANGTSGAVGFSNAPWNGSLPTGGATEFGFQGTGSAAGLTVTCAG